MAYNYQQCFHVPIENGNLTFLNNQAEIKEDLDISMVRLQMLLLNRDNILESGPVRIGLCRVLLQKHEYRMEKLDYMKNPKEKVEDLLLRARVCMLNIHDWRDEIKLHSSEKPPPPPASVPLKHPSANLDLEPKKCIKCDRQRNLKGLNCNHMACGEHWKEHLLAKFDDPTSEMSCIGEKCHLILHDEMVRKLLEMTNTRSNGFQVWKVRNYLRTNKFLLECPANCGRIVKVPNRKPRKIECLCGHEFITDPCCDTWHAPLPCYLWQLAGRYATDQEIPPEDPLLAFMAGQTKRCPKCTMPVVKGQNDSVEKCPQCQHLICSVCLEKHDECGGGFIGDRKTFVALRGIFESQEYRKDYGLINDFKASWLMRDELMDRVKKINNVLTQHGVPFDGINQLEHIAEKVLKWQEDEVNFHIFGFFFTKYSPTGVDLNFERNFSIYKSYLEILRVLMKEDISRIANNRDQLEGWKRQTLHQVKRVKSRRELILSKAVVGTSNLTYQFLMREM